MAKSSTVTVKDHGAAAIVKSCKSKPMLDVGIVAPKANKLRGRFTVAQIASVHEFGSVTVPKRPFIGGWFDHAKSETTEFLRKAAGLHLMAKIDDLRYIELVGSKFVGGIKKYMTTNIAPPLKAETIRRKKSSVALIDKGIMRSSITYRKAPK